jgi:hypothetical protein
MDYYNILNISSLATHDQIKKAFLQNKTPITKRAYKILKHNRYKYDKQ